MRKTASVDNQKESLIGLKNSSFLATILTIFGHGFLGFEQSLAQLGIAIITGYTSAIVFEAIDSYCSVRRPRFRGKGWKGVAEFLLSAHMTSITMSFLLYTTDQIWPLVFAVSLAIASKFLFRYWDGTRYRHFFNPSNFGITMTFLLIPSVNTIPYHFSAGLSGIQNWLIVIILSILGLRLNFRFTRRIPVILSFLSFFIIQSVLRSYIGGDQLILDDFMPMTGPAFILFTMYMITDPMTSPSNKFSQVVYGAAISISYGFLMTQHIPFTLFFAVTMVTGIRGFHLFSKGLAMRNLEGSDSNFSSIPSKTLNNQGL